MLNDGKSPRRRFIAHRSSLSFVLLQLTVRRPDITPAEIAFGIALSGIALAVGWRLARRTWGFAMRHPLRLGAMGVTLWLFVGFTLVLARYGFPHGPGLSRFGSLGFYVGFNLTLIAALTSLGYLIYRIGTDWVAPHDRTESAVIGRRQALKRLFWGAVAAGGALYSWTWAVSAYRPRWSRPTLPLPALPTAFDGIRVAQLTDLHVGPFLSAEYLRGWVERVMRERPDLIVLTGDFVTASPDYAAGCADALAGLAAPLGVWACLGNHDHWADANTVTAALEAIGVTVLRNRSGFIDRNGERLWIVGVEDLWSGLADPATAFRDVPTGAPAIYLLHNPDGWPDGGHFGTHPEQVPADPDCGAPMLTLSGHTHGGQICLPLVGALTRPISRLPPAVILGGLFSADAGRRRLWVSRGLGSAGIPCRLFCPPEVTLLTLRRS